MARLAYPKRMGLATRLFVSRMLLLVPWTLVRQVRDRYCASAGWRRLALAGPATVLRHRPFGPLKEFSLPGDSGRRFAAVDSRLTRLIYWHGREGYERHEVLWWERLCARATSIVEVGANIGYFTVHGASVAPHARYLAVEAHPQSADVLRRNLALNSLDRVRVVNAAAGGDHEARHVTLALPDQERYLAPTGAYVTSGAEGIVNRPASQALAVSALPARDLFPDDVDLLKLDIEGHEANVLESARSLIDANRPVIVVEVLKRTPRLRRILRELADNDYVAFAIGDDSLHLLTADELCSPDPLPRYGSRDVILAPVERARHL